MEIYNLKTHFDEIKESYQWFEPKIFERYSETKNQSRWVDPYILSPFCFIFSHIERITWSAIRGYGRTPFYPQCPVGKYFVDFGNPIVKVGIECDGKQFHTDLEKDLNRDRNIIELGWTIYRISGSDCNRVVELCTYPEECHPAEVYYKKQEFYSGTIEGLLEALGVRYFNQLFYGEPIDTIDLICKCLNNRVSIKNDEWDRDLSLFVQNYYNKYESLKNK